MLVDWKQISVSCVQVDILSASLSRLPKNFGFALSQNMWKEIIAWDSSWECAGFRWFCLRYRRIKDKKSCSVRLRIHFFRPIEHLGHMIALLRSGIHKTHPSFFMGPVLYQGMEQGFASADTDVALHPMPIADAIPKTDDLSAGAVALRIHSPLRNLGLDCTGEDLYGLISNRLTRIAHAQGLEVDVPEVSFLNFSAQLRARKSWMNTQSFVKGVVGSCQMETSAVGMQLLYASELVQLGKSTIAGLGVVSAVQKEDDSPV